MFQFWSWVQMPSLLLTPNFKFDFQILKEIFLTLFIFNCNIIFWFPNQTFSSVINVNLWNFVKTSNEIFHCLVRVVKILLLKNFQSELIRKKLRIPGPKIMNIPFTRAFLWYKIPTFLYLFFFHWIIVGKQSRKNLWI